MSPMAPEAAAGPLQQAPPDRPSLQIEDWARQGLALLGADRVLDMNEKRILRAFFEQVSLLAQNGGIGNGAQPPGEAGGAPPMSPMEMNANTEDMGTVEGAVPQDTGGY